MNGRPTPVLVTAIITTKDRRGFLARAVASVFDQTYRPLELVIVDDGSATPVDGASFNAPGNVPLRVIRHEHARGVSAARNSGAKAAKGAYIAFLDDDDRWQPSKIDRQLIALNEDSTAVRACGCQISVVDETGTVIDEPDRSAARDEIIASLTYSDENLTPSTLMFERQAFLELGGYREDMPSAEDREFLLRFLLIHGLAVLPQRLVNFTEHRKDRLTRNSEAMYLGEAKYLEFIERNSQALSVDRPRALGYRNAKVGHQAMLAGKWRIGIEHFFAGLMVYPFDKRVFGGAILALLGPRIYHRLISLRIDRIR